MSLEEEFLATGAHGRLPDAMSAIHPDLQAVLLATTIDGLTTKETACMFGIPHGTVETRLRRARAQLQEILT